MKTLTTTFLLGLTASLTLTACSQTTPADTAPASPTLSLERIYQDREFKSERAPYFRWLDDGTGYTVLEARDKDNTDTENGVTGNDIVFYQPNGEGRKVLVTVEQLTPAGNQKALSIEDYKWSADGNWALIFTNGQKVWRHRTRAITGC